MTKEKFLLLVGEHEFFYSKQFKVLSWDVQPHPKDGAYVFEAVVDKNGKELGLKFCFDKEGAEKDLLLDVLLNIGLSRLVQKLSQEEGVDG